MNTEEQILDSTINLLKKKNAINVRRNNHIIIFGSSRNIDANLYSRLIRELNIPKEKIICVEIGECGKFINSIKELGLEVPKIYEEIPDNTSGLVIALGYCLIMKERLTEAENYKSIFKQSRYICKVTYKITGKINYEYVYYDQNKGTID